MTTLQWLQLAMGAAFVLAGVIAWRARPANRTGPIMLAFGAATILGRSLVQSQWAPGVTLGILVMDGATVVFMYLLLAFPAGRLTSRRDWLILGPVLVVFVPLELLWLSFLELPDGLNAIAFWPDPAAADAVDWVQRAVLVVADTALAIVLVRRWLRASRPMRRALAPVLIGAACLMIGTFTVVWEKLVAVRTDLIGWLVTITFVALPAVLLINLLRVRLARSAVGGLLADLRENDDPAHLRDALRRALGDPSLTIAFWLPEYGAYADLDGAGIELPREDGGVAITLLERGDGFRVAALVHDASLRQDPELLRDVATAAAIALENARLQTELRANAEELRGSRVRAFEAADGERRRLERDLHDGAQRRLVTLSMSLGMLEHRFEHDPEARALVADAKREAVGSLQELRDLAHGIHPAVLTSHGLAAALESVAAAAPVHVDVDVALRGRLPPVAEVAAYYLICEALTNTGKHAHASRASVAVRREPGRVVVEIADDGVGGADTHGGSGLRGLADRVEALDGSLRVVSPIGAGTQLRAEIPCASS